MADGIILIDKEEGYTSRDVDNILSGVLKTKKSGHLGTLDPFATGLLISAVGKGTKFLPYIDDSKKTYVASLKLGEKTSTGDLGGGVMEMKEVPTLSIDQIEEVLSSFLGEGLQTPPMHSAIKVDGIPLYKLAHKGKEIERKPRKIEIFSMKAISFIDGILTFETEVSRGTYIRVLGEDIAQKLGTVGHLISLRRTEIGNVDVSKGIHVKEAKESDVLDPTPFLIPYGKYEVPQEDLKRVYDGAVIDVGKDMGEFIYITHKRKVIAFYSNVKGTSVYRSERGLF